MKCTVATLLLILAAAVPAAAQGDARALASARDLYAAARYDEALAVLNGITAEPADRKAVEQYRSLCLLALGREPEAEGAIAAVITADPFYLPSEAEASPRVRTAFAEVRRRLLPEIATARYAAAKRAFDRKEYGAAEHQFRQLMALLDDRDMAGRLADMRVLAAGFLDLSTRAAAPPAPATKAAPKAAEPSRPAGPDPNRIYVAEDPGVTAPVALKQNVPRVPSSVTSQARDRGLLELVIDEQGRVITMAVRVSIHPMYDAQLLTAARDWRYRPATLAGQPVKFRKMLQIAVSRR